MDRCQTCTHIMVCETPKRKCAYYRRRINRHSAYFPRLTNQHDSLCDRCGNRVKCHTAITYAGKEPCVAEKRYQRLKAYEDTGLSPESIRVLIGELGDA